MRNPVDIVEELVSRIDNTITAKSVVDNSDGTFSLMVCDIKYATTQTTLNGINISSIIDHGTYYEIILVTNTEPVAPFLLNAPKYYDGTAIGVNQELIELQSNPSRPSFYPMIYFPDTLRGTDYSKYTPEMDAECRLVFAVNRDISWTNKQIKKNCINPMLVLLDEMKHIIDKDKSLLINNYRVIQYYRLGEKVETRGTISNMINDYCSGIVVDFNMVVYPDFECKCCCKIS